MLDCTSVPLPTGPRPIGIQQMLSTLRMLSTDHDNQRRARVNKILYRAKQRGFLELDLLIGTWAEKNTALLPEAELDAMEEVCVGVFMYYPLYVRHVDVHRVFLLVYACVFTGNHEFRSC